MIRVNLSIANMYILRGRRTVLVDTGTAGTADRALRALAGHGVRPDEVSLILLTHAHSDHAGGARALREAFNAPVAVHRADADMARRGDNGRLIPIGLEARFSQRFVDRPFPPLEPDIIFDDDFDPGPFGLDATVIPTPGHSPGSVSLLLPGGEAIVGDILRGGIMGGALLSGRPSAPYFLYDLADRSVLVDSVRRVLDAGATILYTGHGGPLKRSAAGAWLAGAISGQAMPARS
jgi:glyoxylase-like metal-dependent hydrolase (beta-lactamase superfamily II)